MGTAALHVDSTREANAKPSIWLRFFPSLTDLAFLFPIWFAFSALQGTRCFLADGDTGWHIRTGDWILQHGQVPYRDIFSFTKAGQPWFAWEWAWDVLASLIHTQWGLSGIVFANAVLLGFISAFLFRLVLRHVGNPVWALLISCSALLGSVFHWVSRPHLLSWLFVLLFLDVIDRFEHQNQNRLWCLPPLTLLWVNIHGSFFVGISFLMVYAAVGAAQHFIKNAGEGSDGLFERSKTYFRYGLLCAAVTLINPYGWHLYQHLISFLSDSEFISGIGEYKSVNFKYFFAHFYEFFLLVGSCAALWLIGRGKWSQAVLILLWAHLSLGVVRNAPIFLFIAAAPTAQFLTHLCKEASASATAIWFRKAIAGVASFGIEFSGFEKVGRIHLVSAMGLVVFAAVLPLQKSTQMTDFDARDFPVAAASLIKGDLDTRVFTTDRWGDYLIYHFYPHVRVFVDGRADLYGKAFSSGWIRALNADYDWRKELSEYSINSVLLPTKSPLASVLKQSGEWRSIFDDGTAIVFCPVHTKVSSGIAAGR